MSDDVLVRVENVSKRFCRSLKRSLWYGLQDLGSELGGRRHGGGGGLPQSSADVQLRPDEFWAVKDVSFELRRGECIGLLGRNGAGKSTLLKMLNGLIKPDKGAIRMKGRVGALIELTAGMNPVLTGRENIYVSGQVLGLTKSEVELNIEDIIAFAEIDEFIDMPVQNYSSGMTVRLGFAIASQMSPDILIIDEVLAVGDTGFKIKCLNRIHKMLDHSAVVFVSHSMPFVSRLCTHALVLEKGRNVLYTDDIGEGINAYNQAFDSPLPSTSGTGGISVKTIYCNGQSIDKKLVIPFGDPLLIQIVLAANVTFSNLRMRIQIWNQDQIPVADLVNHDYQTFTWENTLNEAMISVNLPSIRFAPGCHSATIYIARAEPLEVLCRVENAFSFIVGNHLSTGCHIFLPAKYQKDDIKTAPCTF